MCSIHFIKCFLLFLVYFLCVASQKTKIPSGVQTIARVKMQYGFVSVFKCCLDQLLMLSQKPVSPFIEQLIKCTFQVLSFWVSYTLVLLHTWPNGYLARYQTNSPSPLAPEPPRIIHISNFPGKPWNLQLHPNCRTKLISLSSSLLNPVSSVYFLCHTALTGFSHNKEVWFSSVIVFFCFFNQKKKKTLNFVKLMAWEE